MSGPLSTAAQAAQRTAANKFDDQPPGALQQCPLKFWVDVRLSAVGRPHYPADTEMEWRSAEFYRVQLPDGTERSGFLDSLGEFYSAGQPSGTAQIVFEQFFADIDTFCGHLSAARAKPALKGR